MRSYSPLSSLLPGPLRSLNIYIFLVVGKVALSPCANKSDGVLCRGHKTGTKWSETGAPSSEEALHVNMHDSCMNQKP